jgi:hypothetical protein
MKTTTIGAIVIVFGAIAGIGGIALAVPAPTQNVRPTLISPSACSCSTAINIGRDATLANCQCGAIQCVVAVGGQKVDSNPAISCFK